MYELVSFNIRENPQVTAEDSSESSQGHCVRAGPLTNSHAPLGGRERSEPGAPFTYFLTKRTTISMMLSRRATSARGESRSRWKISAKVWRLATLNTASALIDMCRSMASSPLRNTPARTPRTARRAVENASWARVGWRGV